MVVIYKIMWNVNILAQVNLDRGIVGQTSVLAKREMYHNGDAKCYCLHTRVTYVIFLQP